MPWSRSSPKVIFCGWSSCRDRSSTFARRAHIAGQNSVHVVSEHVVKNGSGDVATE